VNKTEVKENLESAGSWDQAIADAQALLEQADREKREFMEKHKRKTQGLKDAIESFTAFRKAGEPYRQEVCGGSV
jgi:hypothetical protein